MVICLERGADLHMAQLMPLSLTVCCFSKIQIGFTFLVPIYPGSHGKRAVKRVCVCVCVAMQGMLICLVITTSCEVNNIIFLAFTKRVCYDKQLLFLVSNFYFCKKLRLENHMKMLQHNIIYFK